MWIYKEVYLLWKRLSSVDQLYLCYLGKSRVIIETKDQYRRLM